MDFFLIDDYNDLDVNEYFTVRQNHTPGFQVSNELVNWHIPRATLLFKQFAML